KAFAIVLDGDLSDWGVTPFTQWVPSVAGTSYSVENNYNRQWSDAFNEKWDIEAMYINDCSQYLNFAIVSSNPYTSGWAHESLFLDFSGRTMDQLLVNGDYKYAADLANLPLGLSTKGVYKVNQSKAYKLVNYKNSGKTFPGSIAMTPAMLAQQELLGDYEVFNKYLGVIEPGAYKNTYVLEGRIDKSLFEEDLLCGSTLEAYFARITCLKDWITVRDTLGGNCNNIIPEPTALLLFGPGAFLVSFFRRKRILQVIKS
ncbi:MAG: PEP-CTERM sorting domain-containing protein, partial [Candidatus Omnitrophica bacterium]|nr:PEP-CTERM sorting domain-containing protein [Candidatus Omnitrophota bacterium]